VAMIVFSRNFVLIDAAFSFSAANSRCTTATRIIQTELRALTLEPPAASDNKKGDSNSNSNDNKHVPNRKRRRPSFEDRMRTLVQKPVSDRRSSSNDHTTNGKNSMPPNLQVVSTLEEYKVAVGDEKERLVVVRFFAPWCKACRAIAPAFYRMAGQYPDVSFVEVPVTEKNVNLHQGLEVPSLPFGHIYVPNVGLVEELRISRKFFPQLELALKSYIDGSCELSSRDGDDSSYASSPFASQLEGRQ